MRISDWSSDVCSSDLRKERPFDKLRANGVRMAQDRLVFFGELLIRLTAPGNELLMQSPSLALHVGGAEANVAVGLAHLGHDCAMVGRVPGKIGRASCRGRVCQYV